MGLLGTMSVLETLPDGTQRWSGPALARRLKLAEMSADDAWLTKEEAAAHVSPEVTMVFEELRNIPKGGHGGLQMQLRIAYFNTRREALSRDPNSPARDALQEAIRTVKDQHPDFEPEYDRDHFE
jgi:hypothetical protein